MLAETKDHADWELITKAAEKSTRKQKTTLQAAADEVEEQEDDHLYRRAGHASCSCQVSPLYEKANQHLR